MAASLRLGRQGILFGLRLSHFSKCSRARHPCQEHVRHFFQSPCFLGECWRFDGRAVCPLRLCGQPLTFANIIFNLESCYQGSSLLFLIALCLITVLLNRMTVKSHSSLNIAGSVRPQVTGEQRSINVGVVKKLPVLFVVDSCQFDGCR